MSAMEQPVDDEPEGADPEAESVGHQMRVYQYATLAATDLPPSAIAELRRAHNLRNVLVEIERRHEERVAAVWAQHPELEEASTAVEAGQAAVTVVVEEGKAYRQQHRTTKISPELQGKIKDARATLREAKRVLRDTKSEVYPRLKPRFVEARQERQVEIRSTYRQFVDDGLYWATYNDVVASHDTAVKAVANRRKAGQSGNLKFRSWNGEGTLTVQLQRQKGQTPRTPELLAEPAGRYHNVAYLAPALDPDELAQLSRSEQRKLTRGTLRFRIGSGEHAEMVELPVRIHRPIPPDAEIVLIRVTRRFEAHRPKISVSVVTRIRKAPQRPDGKLVAAHVGWRVRDDKTLRVAVVTGAGPPPDHVQDVVRQHDGWAEVIIPTTIRMPHARQDEIRSTRDRDLNLIRADVVAYAAAHPYVEGLENVSQWRSPSRFVALATRWRNDPPPDGDELAEHLEAWRRQDKHLWTWERAERRQLINRRDNAFRAVAAWLLEEAGVVVIDSWTMQRRLPTVENEDSFQERAARANATLAAPGEFRAVLERAAEARGVTIAPLPPVTANHADCDTPFDVGERRDQIMVWCPRCQRMVDQDYNALQSLLKAVRQSAE